jgi:hypothetical protein
LGLAFPLDGVVGLAGEVPAAQAKLESLGEVLFGHPATASAVALFDERTRAMLVHYFLGHAGGLPALPVGIGGHRIWR